MPQRGNPEPAQGPLTGGELLVRMARAPWVGLGLEATEPNRVFASSEEAAGLVNKREREKKKTTSKEN